MRRIATLDVFQNADVFMEHLVRRKIPAEISEGRDNTTEVWIVKEEDVEKARELLNIFLADPSSLSLPPPLPADTSKKTVKRHSLPPVTREFSVGIVTIILTIISTVLAISSNFGAEMTVIAPLTIASPSASGHDAAFLQEVRTGQIWRLMTPIFLHFGFLHLLFNMLWLSDLGLRLEKKHGPYFFLALVATIGIISNIAQYAVGGPLFGGMSGVVYGLLGYTWIRSRIDPASGFYVHEHTMVLMMIWLVMGMLKVIPHIANAAHLSGLIIGLFLGWLAALFSRRTRLIDS